MVTVVMQLLLLGLAAHTAAAVSYVGEGLMRLECLSTTCTSTGWWGTDFHTEQRYGYAEYEHRYQIFHYYDFTDTEQDFVVFERVKGSDFPLFRHKVKYKANNKVKLKVNNDDVHNMAFADIPQRWVFCVHYTAGADSISLRPHDACSGTTSLCEKADGSLEVRADDPGPCEWSTGPTVYIPTSPTWLAKRSTRRNRKVFFSTIIGIRFYVLVSFHYKDRYFLTRNMTGDRQVGASSAELYRSRNVARCAALLTLCERCAVQTQCEAGSAVPAPWLAWMRRYRCRYAGPGEVTECGRLCQRDHTQKVCADTVVYNDREYVLPEDERVFDITDEMSTG